MKLKSGLKHGAFAVFTLIGFILILLLAACISILHNGNNFDSFSEPYIALDEGWSMTDSSGNTRELSLPHTIDYGLDGRYTLSRALPAEDGLLLSPALRLYSNYIDLTVYLDGQEIYSFPEVEAAFCGATGNTYHFLRLPGDYAGRMLTVDIRCQLGQEISYLLKAPLLGAKSTMLREDVRESLPGIMLAGCMIMLAVALSVMHFLLKRRLELPYAVLCTSLLSLMFGFYVFCETGFAQLMIPNGYMLSLSTLMLLTLLPVPLLGIFAEDISQKYRHVPYLLLAICMANLFVQTVLELTGVISFRELLPQTHAVMILVIVSMLLCMALSVKHKKTPLFKLISALPIVIGGTLDIVLLLLERPSFNNSLWFVLGVSAFIIMRFCGFIANVFNMYRQALEGELLMDMAYRDLLTGIGNRNSYERKLKELSDAGPDAGLCCVVIDINDLKHINDTLGHQAGDSVIMTTGSLISELLPTGGSCFRTGGDEFVLLLENCTEEKAGALAERLRAEAGRRGAVRLSLAIGSGAYAPSDGNVNDFIRRVDADMYENKRALKSGPDYPYKHGALK